MLARTADDVADVGQDQHRQILLEETFDRPGRCAPFGDANIGERVERTRQIIDGVEQRLRRLGRGAGNQADGAAAPALVEQLHGAGGTFGGDFEPGDVVANLDREIELRRGLAFLGLELEARIAERQALEIERADDTGFGSAGFGAQHLHAQSAGRVVGRRQRMGGLDAAGDDGNGPAIEQAREARDERIGMADIDAVGEPDQLDLGRGLEKAGNRPERFGAIERVRFRPDLAQPDARGSGSFQRDVATGLGERHDRNAAAVGFRAGDELVGGAQANVPGRGGPPGIIDQQCDRRRLGGGRERRVPQRTGDGKDHERGQRQSQQRQPPRRTRRGLLARRNVE